MGCSNFNVWYQAPWHRIWPLDLVRQLPSTVQLYGFDISSSQFLHPNYLPANVKLEVLDSLRVDPPEELLESFDIVHLRLWLGVVMNGDPSTLLTHALKLLRMFFISLWVRREWLMHCCRSGRIYSVGWNRSKSGDCWRTTWWRVTACR